MPESMTDGDPVDMLSVAKEQSRAEQWRYFTIPGNGQTEWDPEIHGVEIPEENIADGSYGEVAWRPGQYEFNFGASGNSFVLSVPEPYTLVEPRQEILRGFHEFLKVAYDE